MEGKTISLFFFMIAGIFSASAQKKCLKDRVYAYRQNTIMGASPKKGIKENGKPATTVTAASTTYYIYLVPYNDKPVEIIRLWINSDVFSVRTENIEKTPVIIKNSEMRIGKPDTLVPAIDKKVWRLYPVSHVSAQPGRKILKAIRRSQVVIEYKRGNKDFYTKEDSVEVLAPLVLQ